MSNMSAVHDVIEYVSGKTTAFTGQRLSKHSWKTDKISKIKRESKAVSIPVIGDTEILENIQSLLPAIREFLAGEQDKIIKEKLEDMNNLPEFIHQSDIAVSTIARLYAESEKEGNSSKSGGRITKDLVSKWFEENIEETLAVALMEKLGVGEEITQADNDRIYRIIIEFKSKVTGLAGGKTSYSPDLAKSVKKCVELAPAGDELKERFIGRLDKMITAQEVKNLDLSALL